MNSRSWFENNYPLNDFKDLVRNLVNNTKSAHAGGTTRGLKQKFEFSTGMYLQVRYGMGAPSKTSYFNWHVVNVYYDTINSKLHVAVQDNEDREVLGKNIGQHPDLIAQSVRMELPGKGMVYSFYETNDSPDVQILENMYDIFIDLCSRIADIVPATELDKWNFGDSKPGYVIKRTSHEDRLAMRKGLTLRLRYKILQRDKFTCQICGNTATSGVRLHVDHVKPVSRGGDNEPSNLRVLCAKCNISKGARLV